PPVSIDGKGRYWLSLNATGPPYRSDNGRGGSSTAGGTGDTPVCCAKWCVGRREIVIPVTIALPTAIKAMATTPAINTISIWIAMVHPVARRLSDKHIGTEDAGR